VDGTAVQVQRVRAGGPAGLEHDAIKRNRLIVE
jgi:hypothetical protein